MQGGKAWSNDNLNGYRLILAHSVLTRNGSRVVGNRSEQLIKEVGQQMILTDKALDIMNLYLLITIW